MPIKKALLSTIVFVVFMLVGCNNNKKALESLISKQLVENAQIHGIPAQALMVMHNKEVIYRNSIGFSDAEGSKPINRETVFPIYSVTKLFANTLVMQLVEAGQLNLSDPVSNFVSDLPKSWRDIRIEQLINHTSGLPEYFRCENRACQFPESIETAFSRLKETPLLFQPDTQMRYNQTNYILLKVVIENVTKDSYRNLVNRRIIEPLGLKNTWLDLNSVPQQRLVTAYHAGSGSNLKENKVRYPDYAISHSDAYSTLDDLSLFLSGLVQGRLVSKQMLTDYWRPYRLSDGDEGYFATGWEYDQAGNWHAVGHDGGAVVRVRVLYQDTLDNHYIIIYLTNGNKDGVWSRSLVESIQYYMMPDLFSRIASIL